MAQVLVTRERVLQRDAFGVRVDLPVDADRAFGCDHLLVLRTCGRADLFAVYDAQPLRGRPGWASVGAVPIGRSPSVEDALHADALAVGEEDTGWRAVVEAGGVALLPAACLDGFPGATTPRRDADVARLLELRAQWNWRYALPGREPLTTPVVGLVAWLARRPGQPLLLLGDGEGRSAIPAAADGRPVRVLELSGVAVETCRRLNRSSSLEVVTGDFVRWVRHGVVPPRTLVAATYVGPFQDEEWRGIAAFLARVLDQGGGFYWEAARAGLDHAQQDVLRGLGATDCTEFCRDGDDVERIIVSSRP